MHEEKILEDIYQNANTGAYSIETILPRVEDAAITAELISQQSRLEEIAHTARLLMAQKHIDPSDAGVMSKMGIWAGVQLNAIRDNSASHIADMVIKGDTMGITKMTRELNHAPVEDPQVRRLGEELIDLQRRSIETLKQYL